MAGGVGVSLRVAKTTIEEWGKKVSEETVKYLPLMALLKKRGRIEKGCSGGQFRWVVRIADHEINDFVDMQPVTFGRTTTVENAFLPWRGYYFQDAISLREKLEQGGPEAMIKIFSSRSDLIKQGAMRALADELYKDGNAAGNTNKFHGLESFMGIGAQTNTSIIASTHDDTYANLSTAVNTVGGTSQPRIWTPVIINSNYVSGGVTQSWANYADEYIREGILRGTYGTDPANRPDLIMLSRDSFKSLLDLLDDKERISIARGSNLELTKLGFENHVQLDGVSVMWDASVPTTDSDAVTVRGYMFTVDRMKLKILGSPNSDLFMSKVTFNDSYRADHIFLSLLGNWQFESPRHFGKFADIAAVAS